MRKLKNYVQTVILIVVLFLLASPMLMTYAKNLFAENEVNTIEELNYSCEDLMLTAGVTNVLYNEILNELYMVDLETEEKANFTKRTKMDIRQENAKDYIPTTFLSSPIEVATKEKKETEIVAQKAQNSTNGLISLGEYKLTAYCSCEKCCGKWAEFNLTASGTTPAQGRTVACNSLEFGTEIVINGDHYIVEDTGNMNNNVIDIYFNSHEEALNFGVKYAEIFLVQN